MPLTSMLNGNLFWADDLVEEEHRGLPFECDGCKEKMTPVIPTILDRIKHFRHVSGRMHGEPETPEHKAAKMWFYNNFENVKLEHYMNRDGDIHRLDVLIRIGDLKIGIECQHSGISIDEVMKRNKFYIENGIIPIWVLVEGKNFSVKGPITTNEIDRLLSKSDSTDVFERIKRIERYILQKYSVLYYFNGDMYKSKFYKGIGYKTKGWFVNEKSSSKTVINDLLKLVKVPIDKISDKLQECLEYITYEDIREEYYNKRISFKTYEDKVRKLYIRKDAEWILENTKNLCSVCGRQWTLYSVCYICKSRIKIKKVEKLNEKRKLMLLNYYNKEGGAKINRNNMEEYAIIQRHMNRTRIGKK